MKPILKALLEGGDVRALLLHEGDYTHYTVHGGGGSHPDNKGHADNKRHFPDHKAAMDHAKAATKQTGVSHSVYGRNKGKATMTHTVHQSGKVQNHYAEASMHEAADKGKAKDVKAVKALFPYADVIDIKVRHRDAKLAKKGESEIVWGIDDGDGGDGIVGLGWTQEEAWANAAQRLAGCTDADAAPMVYADKALCKKFRLDKTAGEDLDEASESPIPEADGAGNAMHQKMLKNAKTMAGKTGQSHAFTSQSGKTHTVHPSGNHHINHGDGSHTWNLKGGKKVHEHEDGAKTVRHRNGVVHHVTSTGTKFRVAK